MQTSEQVAHSISPSLTPSVHRSLHPSFSPSDMSLKIPTATLLLLLLSVQVSENHRMPHRRVSPCCTSYSTSDIKVVGNTYRIQAAVKDYGCVHAVIFKTKEGSACANPKEPWVKNLTARMEKA